jgi:hypothetical protein
LTWIKRLRISYSYGRQAAAVSSASLMAQQLLIKRGNPDPLRLRRHNNLCGKNLNDSKSNVARTFDLLFPSFARQGISPPRARPSLSPDVGDLRTDAGADYPCMQTW